MIRELQQAIQKSGLSLTEIRHQSGVSQAQLSRFIRGQRGLSFLAAAKVCEALGLRLVGPGAVPAEPPAKPKRPRRRPPASDN
jgi:hypothetical protein